MKKVFLDVFDGTKTSEKYYKPEECAIHYVRGESLLFYMLMSGNKPMLTQTQVMDSGIIHAILNTRESREPFLQFIREGKIEVALQKGNGAHSVLGYMEQSLKHGIEDGGKLFEFSIFPFMAGLNMQTRKRLYEKALEAIRQHHYDFSVNGVEPKYTDCIKEAVINLQDIDRAIGGRYVQAGDFRQHLDKLILQQAPFKVESAEDAEFAAFWDKLVSETAQTAEQRWRRRSEYYGYLENQSDEGSCSSKVISRARQVIDNNYNIAVASSLQDTEAGLTFSSKYEGLIQPIRHTQKVASQLMTLQPVVNTSKNNGSKQDPLSWSKLALAIREVDEIQRKKNLSRIEAIRQSRKLQFIKPVTMTAHYVAMSAAGNFVSDSVVEGFSLLTGAVMESVDQTAKKPSLVGTLHSYKDSAARSRLLADASQFYSLLVDAD